MNKKIALVALLLIIVPTVALAYSNGDNSPPQLWPNGYWGPLVSCTGNGVGGTQCQSLCDLIGTIVNIIYFAISLCFFIIAPILFITGGIMIMVAGANPEMLSKGKTTLKSTTIGVLIVLCSYLIVATFVGVLQTSNYIQGFGGSSSSINCSSS